MAIYVVVVAVFAAALFLGLYLGGKGRHGYAEKAALADNLQARVDELTGKSEEQTRQLIACRDQITALTAERDVQKNTAENFRAQLDAQKTDAARQLAEQKSEGETALCGERERAAQRIAELQQTHERQLAELRQENENYQKKQQEEAAEYRRTEAKRNSDAIESMRLAYETQIAELKAAHERQLNQTKEGNEKQIEALKQMNREQVDSQLKLIKEQMQTTSEEILKRRQEELGERNREQVSKIIDPLQESLKAMREAFDKSKEQQSEALTRLDETIKINMQKSAALGETADRLTRALTGEVKMQGNFGELKLKQLLEDLELHEGEQFDTQETLRDKAGRQAKGDDGKGLVPDFILHFPNNRHVVVDSKMSLTAYERYIDRKSVV